MTHEEKIRVLLVDDHQLFREGIKRIINLEEDMKVIAEFADGKTFIENYRDLNPDVILMDINMPNMNGVEATKKVKQFYPESKVMILSIHDDEGYVFETLRAGAIGYLLKDMDAETLLEAIRAVNEGRAFIHQDITGKVINEYRRLSISEQKYGFGNGLVYADRIIDWRTILTKREADVLQLMVEGNTNRQIGEMLYISEKTVKNHVSKIFQKLNVQDRTQAVLAAVRNGWVDL